MADANGLLKASELRDAGEQHNLDNIGQTTLNPNLPHHKAAMTKLGALMGRDLADEEKNGITSDLRKYHARLVNEHEPSVQGQVRVFLSLLHTVTPDAADLQQAGLSAEKAAMQDRSGQHKAQLKQAMAGLKLGQPMPEKALKQKLPVFLQEIAALAAEPKAVKEASSFNRLGNDTIRAIDKAGQALVSPLGGVAHQVTQEELQEIMQTTSRAKLKTATAKLLQYHSAIVADDAVFEPAQMKMHLSLLHEVQPGKDVLLAKGMDPQRAEEAAASGQSARTKIEIAMSLLGMGEPLTGAALQEQMPAFLDGLPAPQRKLGK